MPSIIPSVSPNLSANNVLQRQQKILFCIAIKEDITQRELAQQLDLSHALLEQDLKQLQNLKLLECEGEKFSLADI